MTNRRDSSSWHVLVYGRERIPFDLSYDDRKRLTVHVEPDQRVRVLAPANTSIDKVMARLQRRAGWISRQRRYFEEFIPPPPPKKFVEGETHRYLGRQYRLKFVRAEKKEVKLGGRFFRVLGPSRPSSSEVEELLDAWYRERGHLLLSRKVEAALQSSFLRGIETPRLQIRKMKRRWGSCTKNSGIIFNRNVLMAPLACIEYVVVHELCHLKVHDHSGEYYNLLTKCMPDWERRKERLNSQDWERS